MRRDENCRHRRCWTVASLAGTFWRRRRLAVPALSFAAATWNRLPAAGPRSRDETYCTHHHRCTKNVLTSVKILFQQQQHTGRAVKLCTNRILYNGRKQWLLLLVFQRYFIINNVITNVAQNAPWGRKKNHFSFMNKSFNTQCNLTKFSTLIVNEYYHRRNLFNFWNLH